jgi:hypothetical protein
MVQRVRVFLGVVIASPAVARAIRYELFPDPDIKSNPSCRTGSAYVVGSVLRANYRDQTANNGSCVKLDWTIGRASLNETYVAHAVTDAVMIKPFLPVIGVSRLIDPATDVQLTFATPGYA